MRKGNLTLVGSEKLFAPVDRVDTRAEASTDSEVQALYGGHSEPRFASTSVVDLGDASLRLRSPIVVVLEVHDDEAIASWPEVEAWGSGTTPAEAINALKDELLSLYRELREASEEELGKLPRRWKQALRAIIVEAPAS